VSRRGLVRLLLLAGLATSATLLGGCGQDEPIEPHDENRSRPLPPWPEGKKAAVSLTFDDGTPGHVHVAAPLLERRHLRGTFFLPTDRIGVNGTTWDDWKTVHENGHEIGSHSRSHRSLVRLTDEEIRREIDGSVQEIEARIPGVRCVTFAYPYGRWSGAVRQRVAQRYLAARTVDPGTVTGTVDLAALPTLMPPAGTQTGEILSPIREAVARKGWTILCFHGILGQEELPGDPGWDTRPVSELEAVLDGLLDLGDEVWIAPLGEVAAWIQGDLPDATPPGPAPEEEAR
jgi:peptidoglycan/xylan/chitin deacetylase (PgdA/CDA1 family)